MIAGVYARSHVHNGNTRKKRNAMAFFNLKFVAI